MDVDESNQAASAANVTREFIRRHAGPAIDAYRFSKMATKAIDLGPATEETIDVSGAIQALKRDIAKVRKYGTANLVCYVSSEVMNAIELYKEGKGSFSLQNEGTAIETRVTMLDGVRLIEVFEIGSASCRE